MKKYTKQFLNVDKSSLSAGLYTGEIFDFEYDSKSNHPRAIISIIASPIDSEETNHDGRFFESSLEMDDSFHQFIKTFSIEKHTTDLSALRGIYIDFTVEPVFKNGKIENQIIGLQYSYDLNESLDYATI